MQPSPPSFARTTASVVGGLAAAAALAWLAISALPESPLPVSAEADVNRRDLQASLRTGHATASPATLEKGRVYYAQLCMPCHGVRGDGLGEYAYRVVPRPTDLTRARTRSRSDDELYRIVSDGLVGTAMVGWADRLTEAQRRQIVAYLRLLGSSEG